MLTPAEKARFKKFMSYSKNKIPMNTWKDVTGYTKAGPAFIRDFILDLSKEQFKENLIKGILASIESVEKAFKVKFTDDFSADIKIAGTSCKLYVNIVKSLAFHESPAFCVSLFYKTKEKQLINKLKPYAENMYTLDFMAYEVSGEFYRSFTTPFGGSFDALSEQLYIENKRVDERKSKVYNLNSFSPAKKVFFITTESSRYKKSYTAAQKIGDAFKKAVVSEIKKTRTR